MSGEPDDVPTPELRRYWCRRGERPGEVIFDPDESKHVRRVMRVRAGERLEAIDGSGRVLSVELEPGRGQRARGRVLRESDPEPLPAIELWLGQAIIRPSRLEWVVEKAVEIGIAGFIPLVTRHSLPARRLTAVRRTRLERIARAAVAQSLGTRAPAIAAPTPLGKLDLEAFDQVRVAHVAAGGPLPEGSTGGRILVVVGPEGGFAPPGIADLEARGAQPIRLGRRRLRSETAAIAVLALTRWGPGMAAGERPQ